MIDKVWGISHLIGQRAVTLRCDLIAARLDFCQYRRNMDISLLTLLAEHSLVQQLKRDTRTRVRSIEIKVLTHPPSNSIRNSSWTSSGRLLLFVVVIPSVKDKFSTHRDLLVYFHVAGRCQDELRVRCWPHLVLVSVWM